MTKLIRSCFSQFCKRTWKQHRKIFVATSCQFCCIWSRISTDRLLSDFHSICLLCLRYYLSFCTHSQDSFQIMLRNISIYLYSDLSILCASLCIIHSLFCLNITFYCCGKIYILMNIFSVLPLKLLTVKHNTSMLHTGIKRYILFNWLSTSNIRNFPRRVMWCDPLRARCTCMLAEGHISKSSA